LARAALEGTGESSNDVVAVEGGQDAYEYVNETLAQPPFQPGSTPSDASGRRFLVWNHVGAIVSRAESAFSSIEIEFADTSKHRSIRITDQYNFTRAALGDTAAVFACRSSAGTGTETLPSVIFYRPFRSWTNNRLRLDTRAFLPIWTPTMLTLSFLSCLANGNVVCLAVRTPKLLRLGQVRFRIYTEILIANNVLIVAHFRLVCCGHEQ
jgi:hypothetical protein